MNFKAKFLLVLEKIEIKRNYIFQSFSFLKNCFDKKKGF